MLPRRGGYPVRVRKYVIECCAHTAKVGLDRLVREGCDQTVWYMDR